MVEEPGAPAPGSSASRMGSAPWRVSTCGIQSHMDDLIEIEDEATMTREEAAERLRALADQLSRHNEVTFLREGQRYTVKVPKEVKFSFELEVGEDNELEVEISW